MNKEKFIQFLSNAIDNGAKIDILFYGDGESKEVAENRTKEFVEIIGAGEIEELTNEYSRFNWFAAEAQHVARITHFYEDDEIETEVTA